MYRFAQQAENAWLCYNPIREKYIYPYKTRTLKTTLNKCLPMRMQDGFDSVEDTIYYYISVNGDSTWSSFVTQRDILLF